MQTTGPQPDEFSHQVHLSDQKYRIKKYNYNQAADEVAWGQGRCWKIGGQNAADGPGLAPVFRHKPAQFDGNPGYRQAEKQRF